MRQPTNRDSNLAMRSDSHRKQEPRDHDSQSQRCLTDNLNMAWFKNRYGNPLVWETQITEGGGRPSQPVCSQRSTA